VRVDLGGDFVGKDQHTSGLDGVRRLRLSQRSRSPLFLRGGRVTGLDSGKASGLLEKAPKDE
jgi:hypothetical protein